MASTAQNKQLRSGLRTPASSLPKNRANGVDGTEGGRPNGHIKFDSDDDGDGDDEGEDGGVALPTENEDNAASPASATDEGSDGEDDAPETVTMRSGKDAARRREKEAKKAIEAYESCPNRRHMADKLFYRQEGAARQKRKRREAVFKEQKEDARKRRKIASSKLAAASDDSTNEDALKPAPTLLPESLLERISNHPSPALGSNRSSNSEIGSGHKGNSGDLSAPSKNRERDRKKRLARKAKMEFKKGPVSVKVLREDKKIRRVLMPPADKKAVNTRNAWLSGRGQVKRRSIGGGLGAFRT